MSRAENDKPTITTAISELAQAVRDLSATAIAEDQAGRPLDAADHRHMAQKTTVLIDRLLEMLEADVYEAEKLRAADEPTE